jgi:hypothetical protein
MQIQLCNHQIRSNPQRKRSLSTSTFSHQRGNNLYLGSLSNLLPLSCVMQVSESTTKMNFKLQKKWREKSHWRKRISLPWTVFKICMSRNSRLWWHLRTLSLHCSTKMQDTSVWIRPFLNWISPESLSRTLLWGKSQTFPKSTAPKSIRATCQ